MEVDMTEQEKFEAMFSDPSVDKTKRHGRPDQYKDLTANLLWEGWQAAKPKEGSI